MHVLNDTADPFYPSLKAGAYASKRPYGDPCDLVYSCPTPPANHSSPDSSITAGKVAGIVIGALLGVVVIIFLWVKCVRPNNSQQTDNIPPGAALIPREDNSGNTPQASAPRRRVEDPDNASRGTTLRQTTNSPINIHIGHVGYIGPINNTYISRSHTDDLQNTALRRTEEYVDSTSWDPDFRQTEYGSDDTSQGISTIFRRTRPL